MMRLIALVLATALAGMPAPTQNKADQPEKQEKKAAKSVAKTISLSGCVVRSETPPNQFTLDDANEGEYRLSGLSLRDYLGQRVQIAGAVVETKRLTIKGGLTPNANVAAQAGSMDPARAAMASAGGAAGPGVVNLPEFKVKSVRPVSGGCPD